MYKKVPNELKKLNQWVCWSSIPDAARPGKNKKVPINAKTGGNAQSNNPDTWIDFETAVLASANFDGLGFMLGNGIFGIDLDNMQGEIDEYKNNANKDNVISEFIHSLGSYAEYSPSGNGIHILCKGSLPPGGRRKGSYEFYEQGRFFTVTGKSASEYTEIKDCTESVKFLHTKYIGTIKLPSVRQQVETVSLDEREIIKIAINSKRGQAFSTLHNGIWEGLYSSQSEADMAFSNMLAFWTGCDRQKMDNIFRASGLMRPKWDRKTGNSTYGENTLNQAIMGCTETFKPGSGIEDYGIILLDQNDKKLHKFDDTGNAERFVKNYQNIMRYSYIDKSWMFYDGKRWKVDNTGEIKKLSDEILEIQRQEIALCEDDEQEKAFLKHLRYSRNNKGKTAMLRETEHRVSVLPDEFDKDVDVLNTQNGILDLKTGNLHEHGYDKFLSKIITTEYTEKTDCPKWIQFLHEIFDNDIEVINYIQRAVGYSLTGHTSERCVFFCYGNGRNGKSVFLDTLSNVLGDYAMNIQPESIMVKQGVTGASGDIARLKGARFVTTVEPNEGLRLNEGLLKQLSGGDRITARHLYGKDFEYTPEFKLWMATNHKPIVRGRDDGIWSRLHLIPFTVQIPEEKVDKNLKYKLQQEYTGILTWAFEGCLLWQREGLGMPMAVEDAISEYKSEMDVISAFLEECTVRGPGEVKARDLYNAYANWADENNEYKMSNTKFGKEISLRLSRIKRPDCNYYSGIRILEGQKPYRINLNF